jgi:Domain of unknown function (DUF4170)
MPLKRGENVRQTTSPKKAGPNKADPQRLHLVFGGELTALDSHEFRDLNHLDIVGVFPNYDSAFSAWKAAAQRTVDNAMMRYVIVHLHKLLEPDASAHPSAHSGNEAAVKS